MKSFNYFINIQGKLLGDLFTNNVQIKITEGWYWSV